VNDALWRIVLWAGAALVVVVAIGAFLWTRRRR